MFLFVWNYFFFVFFLFFFGVSGHKVKDTGNIQAREYMMKRHMLNETDVGQLGTKPGPQKHRGTTGKNIICSKCGRYKEFGIKMAQPHGKTGINNISIQKK